MSLEQYKRSFKIHWDPYIIYLAETVWHKECMVTNSHVDETSACYSACWIWFSCLETHKNTYHINGIIFIPNCPSCPRTLYNAESLYIVDCSNYIHFVYILNFLLNPKVVDLIQCYSNPGWKVQQSCCNSCSLVQCM